MNTIVCIPTYNESENIVRLIHDIHALLPSVHVLVIDDGSPDGTSKAVKKRIYWGDGKVHIIERASKMGLGTAYCAGFAWALERNYDVIMQMDADFSHDPADLVRLIEKIDACDLVIGSRYVQGVNVINWPMSRLLLSWMANLYTRAITGMPVADATGGFKAFRSSVLKGIDLSRIRSNGYAFQIEMNYRAWRLKSRMCEIPIVFTDRVSGESKMSKNIIYEAAILVWRLKLRTLLSFGKR